MDELTLREVSQSTNHALNKDEDMIGNIMKLHNQSVGDEKVAHCKQEPSTPMCCPAVLLRFIQKECTTS